MSTNDGVDLRTLSLADLLTKRRSLRRKLAAKAGLSAIRIAVLGGSTTSEVVDLLELWLLDAGFEPVFYQSQYGRFYVDAVHDTAELEAFKPDIVYVHSSVRNIEAFAAVSATDTEMDAAVDAEFARFEQIWTSIEKKLGCIVIQNNFEFPAVAMLGNLDAILGGGQTRFVLELNRRFARAATTRPTLMVQDVCSIAAQVGLAQWFDPERWYSFKLAVTPQASLAIATSLTSLVRAIYGRTRKVLVLDLDNTLWGGVIGDDGVDRIQIGRETPVAEAYTAFQEYCLALRQRGVLLAVCSKNDEEVARQGFAHPDSVLRLEHFSAFKANWRPKHENIAAIAEELSLGCDSFVFVDDNPAERAIVAAQLAGIAVPEVGRDVTAYAGIIEAGRYFEQVSLSREDVDRAALYRENSDRTAFQAQFADYGEYLDSLEMVAEIDAFKPVYLERITQLANKTNQFNLTTRRYTLAEIERLQDDPDAVGLYGRLSDRFGDNGLISVVIGHRDEEALAIDLWLMSCRVLKREMETAMLDGLAQCALRMGLTSLRGYYVPTRKNSMVAEHYTRLGFELVSREVDASAVFALDITRYRQRNRHIRVQELVLVGH